MLPATPPTPEPTPVPAPRLEMAHVLYMDIVAYTKLKMEEQHSVLGQLQADVCNNAAVARAQAEDKLVRLPTGDGMALVFFGDPDCPVKCALELSRTLGTHPEIKLRMGIHTGLVYRVADIAAAGNVAGGGINVAKQVMDCGDARHILVSKTVADLLTKAGTASHISLQDLGEAGVEDGGYIHIYNLYTENVGNAYLPQKLQAAQQAAAAERSRSKRRKLSLAMVVALVVVALAAVGFFYSRWRSQKLTVKDTILLADFANRTGDPVFDDTLETALGVALKQSPFLDVLSDAKVAATLKLMGRSAGTVLTPETARELCLRAGSKAFIAGSIAAVGKEYELWLKAVNCQSGKTLGQEQVRAAAKEKVLDGLGEAAAKLRGKLGESLSSVKKYDVPLEEATTPSLEALKAYSFGRKTGFAKGPTAALPFYKRAVELDSNFAMPYIAMANAYGALGETGRSAENARKAYDLREKVSDRERFSIEANYYLNVTGELERAGQAYELWQQTYPRDRAPYASLPFIYGSLGDYEKALEESREILRENPNNQNNYNNVSAALVNLNRLDEAEAVFKRAEELKLEGAQLLAGRYDLAFLKGDAAQMAQVAAAAMGKPGIEDFMLASQADTEAWFGRLKNARELTRRATDSAEHNDAKETAAAYQVAGALREVESGNQELARADADAAVKLAPNRDVRLMAAVGLARAGDTGAAEKLAAGLDKTFPLDTMVQRYWLPTIRAAVALERKDPNRAVDLLKLTSAIELGLPTIVDVYLCPAYLRGEAYLMLHDGKAAAAEFQKFIEHYGLVGNFQWGALARLGLARAYALDAAKDPAAHDKAGAAYQDFLTLWRDADPDIPIYKQAKAEYAKLR